MAIKDHWKLVCQAQINYKFHCSADPLSFFVKCLVIYRVLLSMSWCTFSPPSMRCSALTGTCSWIVTFLLKFPLNLFRDHLKKKTIHQHDMNRDNYLTVNWANIRVSFLTRKSLVILFNLGYPKTTGLFPDLHIRMHA
jgi:hypothetical protein